MDPRILIYDTLFFSKPIMFGIIEVVFTHLINKIPIVCQISKGSNLIQCLINLSPEYRLLLFALAVSTALMTASYGDWRDTVSSLLDFDKYQNYM